MSIISDIYQSVQDATYEAAAEGMQFTIITWRKHGNRIKLYRLNEKAGFWILCGIAGHPPFQQAITNWIKHGVTRK